jgi:hypothetical protein
MKVTIVLAILILLGGLAVGYISLQGNVDPSGEMRSHIVNTLDDIKQADSLINALVLESRYGLTADYDELAQLIITIRQGVAQLNTDEAKAYVVTNTHVQQSIADLQEQFTLKTDLIENFKSHNSVLRNSIRYAPNVGDRLIQEAEKSDGSHAVDLLKLVNGALYRWILYANKSDAAIIKENADSLMSVNKVIQNHIALIEYSTHVITIVEEQEVTQRYTQGALSISTQQAIAQLESAYFEHYVALLKGAELQRYYLLVYALCVFCVVAYFALRFRKSYRKLKGLERYRTQQVNIIYKHIGNIDMHVDDMQGAFSSIKDTLVCLGSICSEVKKKDYDSKRVNALLSQALTKYRHLDTRDTIAKTDELLNKSNENAGKASRVIKSLMANSA